MLKVFLTVDTEVWPIPAEWPHIPLSASERCEPELGAYFWGENNGTPLGLPYQLDTLKRFDLKATYFVEPLFSYALGLAPLQKVVSLVETFGQEIGLHLHPEWLTDPRHRPLPVFAGPFLHEYSAVDQSKLIRAGLDRLKEAGAMDPLVFRAGNWGANRATFDALAKNGLLLDASLNAAFGHSLPDLPDRQMLQNPTQFGQVWEFPVTHFHDGSQRGIRPLHVSACSFDEFRFVIDSALAQDRCMLVVVFHSSEFVRTRQLQSGRPAAPQRLLARRFERICGYLAARSDVLETCHFGDVRIADLDLPNTVAPIRSSRTRTTLRIAQQALSYIY